MHCDEVEASIASHVQYTQKRLYVEDVSSRHKHECCHFRLHCAVIASEF